MEVSISMILRKGILRTEKEYVRLQIPEQLRVVFNKTEENYVLDSCLCDVDMNLAFVDIVHIVRHKET